MTQKGREAPEINQASPSGKEEDDEKYSAEVPAAIRTS